MSKYNKTRLIPENERFIHRDYMAHCLRWDFIVNHLRKQPCKGSSLSLLDVGCGEAHQLRAIWGNRLRLKQYVGVDVDKLAIDHALKRYKNPLNFEWDLWHCDFTDDNQAKVIQDEYGQFNIVTCFEVLEHLPGPSEAFILIQHINEILKPGGLAFVSTPTRFKDEDKVTCKNHLYEFTQKQFIDLMTMYFKDVKIHGTMMYTRKFTKLLKDKKKNGNNPEFIRTITILQEYFDSNMISAFLAPAYPEFSRSQLIIGKKK